MGGAGDGDGYLKPPPGETWSVLRRGLAAHVGGGAPWSTATVVVWKSYSGMTDTTANAEVLCDVDSVWSWTLPGLRGVKSSGVEGINEPSVCWRTNARLGDVKCHRRRPQLRLCREWCPDAGFAPVLGCFPVHAVFIVVMGGGGSP